VHLSRKSGILLMIMATLASAQAPSTQPASRPSPGEAPARLRSPEVQDDGRVTFRLRAPNAKAVSVWVDSDYEERPLERDEQGVWAGTFDLGDDQSFRYRFVVDGVNMIDPLNPESPQNSFVSVGKSVAARKRVEHGTVHRVYYRSASLQSDRRMHVYTPPRFDAKREPPYPVLYLLHGSGNDDASWTELGRLPEIMDNLIDQQKVVPMVVVMPDGHNRERRASRPSGAQASTRPTKTLWGFGRYGPFGADGEGWFANEILNDVMPLVETRFHTSPDPRQRAVAGLSMGGNQAVALGLTHAGKFAYVVSFSGALSPTVPGDVRDLVPDPDAINNSLELLWIGIGEQDTRLFDGNRQFADALRKDGIRLTWHQSPGMHGWALWREHLPLVLPQLFRHPPPGK
jgi:enterochelin esterase-like enzyme